MTLINFQVITALPLKCACVNCGGSREETEMASVRAILLVLVVQVSEKAAKRIRKASLPSRSATIMSPVGRAAL